MSFAEVPIIAGTPGVGVEHVTHLLIPGRLRSPDGLDLSASSLDRVRFAADFYHRHNLFERGGIVVGSGYKSPAEQGAEPWTDDRGRVYEGKPEAYSFQTHLIDLGVPESQTRVEPDSIDTVTNFANSAHFFTGNEVVGVVAQRKHLERMMGHIAGKTLAAPFVGLIVPPREGEAEEPDSLMALISTMWIARNLNPNNPIRNKALAKERAENLWRIKLLPSSIVSAVHGSGKKPTAMPNAA
ncbi:MAG: hypothetical protein JWO47_1, partial [Candidatus Saccharibacteria bacterium]|nr:hypothetical protein [Candidatus Saccharibacteria bacterium]